MIDKGARGEKRRLFTKYKNHIKKYIYMGKITKLL